MTAIDQWLARADHARVIRGTVRHAGTARTVAEGTRAVGAALDLASNDYLGLSRDPRVVDAAIHATRSYGTGARASRVVTGTLPVHLELEQELCALTAQPAALAFSSGYTANLAVLSALGGPGTLIVLDEHAHASLRDGARLSRSPVTVVEHNSLPSVRLALETRLTPRALVVVESVYSVLGDAAPLPELAALCAEHDALLVVDEAHGIGVRGDGRGGVYEAALAASDHVVISATLSKALGAQGGAVLGPTALREHLVNTARSFVFDTALAPAAAAAAATACSIIAAEPELAASVLSNAATIATACGVPTAAGAVQSISVGRPERAVRLAAQLEAHGILVGCFRPPSVPDGVSRLRLTASAAHNTQQLVAACEQLTALLTETPE